jgi:hypothetical protein
MKYSLKIEGDDEDARHELETYLAVWKLSSCLHDIDQKCRAENKYGNPTEEMYNFLDEIRILINTAMGHLQ